MKILMVLTSHGELGDTGRTTGFWLEEFATPYYLFKDAGAQVVLASPTGGQPPLDPTSREAAFQTPPTHRFDADPDAIARLASTLRLEDLSHMDFDALYYPGGLGPLWDLAEDRHSIGLIASFIAARKTAGFVCHAPGVLRHVTVAGGRPLVEGRRVTGFTNTEEDSVQMTGVVPFSVEDELKAKGGVFSRGADWAPYVVVDGLLVTGQNPASSAAVATALLKLASSRANRNG